MRFENGKSPNPGGRPSRGKMQLRELLDKAWPDAQRVKAIKRLSDLALNGTGKEAVAAANLLLSYAYGKPTIRRESRITFDKSPSEMTDEELLAALSEVDESGDE